MFRAILAHLQEVLHKQQLVYYVYFLRRIEVGVANLTRNTPNVVYEAPPEDEQVVLKTGRGC
jgi:hypothetical protein